MKSKPISTCLNIKCICIFLVILLTGCASTGEIFNHQHISDTSITSMDARQRAIIVNRIQTAKNDPSFMRICAEPFPDIFALVSSSLTAGFNVKAETNAQKLANAEIAAQLARTFSESGTAIERSQTVNLLNNSMYRTCERYLGGAIDSHELTIQAIRDQKAMVSILAIEQLTNIARPARQTVVIHSSPVEASFSSVLPRTIENAKERLGAATKNRVDKELRIKEALKGSKKTDACDFNIDENEKKEACNSATQDLEQALEEEKTTKIYHENLLAVSSSPITAKSGDGQALTNQLGELKVNNLDSNSIIKIADTVLELARIGASINTDEACLLLAYKVFDTTGDFTKRNEIIRECKQSGALNNNDTSYSNQTVYATKNNTTANKSIYKLYVQSLKNCEGCAELAQKANQIAGEITKSNFSLYPIEYLDDKYMPNENQVRYFDAGSEDIAKKLADGLNIKTRKLLNIKNASKSLIEVWIVQPSETK